MTSDSDNLPNILVVDDIRRTARRYMDAMTYRGIRVTYAPTINIAIDRLQTQEFRSAVIDLHMPLPVPFPVELRPYSRFFLPTASRSAKWSTNVGQLVGMFINGAMGGAPPFAYLSAVAADYQTLAGGSPALGVYDKAKIGAAEFVSTLNSMTESHEAAMIRPSESGQ
jgi:CheY-like chemotaxis protein